MALLLSGYWGGEYWPDSYWHPDYWPGRMTSITLDVSRRTRGASVEEDGYEPSPMAQKIALQMRIRREDQELFEMVKLGVFD